MKGTIFQGSSTSLQLWFYAIYLIASTRCGISAKQLERELGRHPDTQLVYAHRAGRRLIGWLDVADAASLGVVC